MIFLHETHEIVAGKATAFEEAVRTGWRPLVEERGDARLLWFWEHTHGTGPSYQAISITAVRDWATWGALVERGRTDARFRDWDKRAWELRRDVTRKILLPTDWSPLREVDLTAAPAVGTTDTPTMYLHDTGWPFPGKLEDYAAALGSIFHPQVQQSRMISVEACWTTAPGTGKHHEVVLLQKILDWDRFGHLITRGETGQQGTGWMVEGLKYRDRWESKLLRCARWSPRQ
jgi:NIPSNAP